MEIETNVNTLYQELWLPQKLNRWQCKVS